MIDKTVKMSLVRALGEKSSSWFFRRAPRNGHVTLYSSSVSDVRQEYAQVKPYKDIPGPRGLYQWPVIGSLLHFKPFTDKTVRDLSNLYTEMLNKYGPIVRMRIRQPSVLICDPKDAEVVLRHEGKYPKRQILDIMLIYSKRNKFRYTIGEAEGVDWYNLRAPLNKRLMRVDSAHHYLEQQNAVADEFIDILASQKLPPEDVQDLFGRFASESIGLICFNARLGFFDSELRHTPEKAAFLTANKDAILYLNQCICGESVAHTWYRNKTYRGFEKAFLTIREQTIKRIEDSKKVLESRKAAGTLDPEEPNLLLSLLSDKDLLYDDIINVMQGLYSAGTDSTASNLIVLFYNLAKNPEKQERLREEVISVLGRDQPVTAQSLTKLPYLKASLKESFRLNNPFPVGPGRILPTDVVLSGYRVPAGVFIQTHTAKSCIDYFEQPQKFMPERWLRSSDGRSVQQFPKLASMPFGFGPRNCLGIRFAEQEIYLAVAKAVQRVEIDVEPEAANTTFYYKGIIVPEKPIKFTFTKLNG